MWLIKKNMTNEISIHQMLIVFNNKEWRNLRAVLSQPIIPSFSLFSSKPIIALSLSRFFLHQILMNTTCCHIPTVLVYLLKLLDSNCSSVKLQDILLQTVLCLQQISFNMMMKSIIQIVQLAQFFRMNVSSYSHMIGSFMSKIEDIKWRKKSPEVD